MKITLLLTGKTEVVPVRELMEDYSKRVVHYVNFEIVATPEIKNIKNLSIEQYKQKESEIQKKYLVKSDFIVLLDELAKNIHRKNLHSF